MDFDIVHPEAYAANLLNLAAELPRKFRTSTGFTPWPDFADGQQRLVRSFVHALMTGDKRLVTYGGKAVAWKTVAMVLSGAPPREISRPLAEALLQTKCMAPVREHMALPAFYLMLPKGLLPTRDGRWIQAVAVMDRRFFASFIPPAFKEGPDGRVREDRFQLDAATLLIHDGHSMFDYGLRYGEVPRATTPEEAAALVAHGDGLDDPNDVEPFDKAAHLVAQVLCVMAQVPELVDQRAVQAEARQLDGWRPKKGPINAVQLGKGYRPRTVAAEPAAGSGSDRQVAAHWRSGHFHTVLHGQGKTQRRLQWFEPVFVNAPWKAAA